MSTTFELKKYKIISLYLNISLVSNTFIQLWLILFKKNFVYGSFINLIILFIPLTIFSIHFLKNRVLLTNIVFTLIWLSLIGSSYLIFHPPAFLLRQVIVDGISHIIIPLLLILEITDMRKFYDSLIPYMNLGLFYCFLQFIYPSPSYYGFTYITAAPSLLSLLLALSLKGRYILFFMIFSISNLLFGGRVWLLYYFIAFILIIYFNQRKIKTIIFLLIALIILILLLTLINQIVNALYSIFPSSRLLSYSVGEFSDNSRSVIWSTLLTEFLKNPLKIRGILSDRLFIAKFYNVTNEGQMAGSYSHNFVIELIYTFGVFGIVILLYFIFKVLRTLKFLYLRKEFYETTIFIIYTALFFGKLSVSSSYLIDLNTGIFLGLLFVLNYNGRKMTISY